MPFNNVSLFFNSTLIQNFRDRFFWKRNCTAAVKNQSRFSFQSFLILSMLRHEAICLIGCRCLVPQQFIQGCCKQKVFPHQSRLNGKDSFFILTIRRAPNHSVKLNFNSACNKQFVRP